MQWCNYYKNYHSCSPRCKNIAISVAYRSKKITWNFPRQSAAINNVFNTPVNHGELYRRTAACSGVKTKKKWYRNSPRCKTMAIFGAFRRKKITLNCPPRQTAQMMIYNIFHGEFSYRGMQWCKYYQQCHFVSPRCKNIAQIDIFTAHCQFQVVR